jgi:hypothetical protein
MRMDLVILEAFIWFMSLPAVAIISERRVNGPLLVVLKLTGRGLGADMGW